MKKKNLFFIGLVCILLAFTFVFTVCDEGTLATDDDDDEELPAVPTGPQAPLALFTRHPTSANYSVGGTAADLIVAYTTIDNGNEFDQSFQWYEAGSFTNSGGTAISGETNLNYTPNVSAAGTKYYYIVITTFLVEEPAEGQEGGTPVIKGVRNAASNPARISVTTVLADSPPYSITVSDTQVQYVRGFGGMSNAFGIGSPARYMQLVDIDKMFNPETGLGYNILRICLFPYPLEEILRGMHYPGMGNSNYVNIVKRVNEYGGYVLASPWTPPANFKNPAILTGNSRLAPAMYRAYADYLRDWVKEMNSRGAPIYTVSLQNEPTHTATYDGMLWSEAQHLNFLKDYAQYFHNGGGNDTGPVPGYGGGKAQPRVLLMGGEPHQKVDWNNSALDDATARGNIDIVAYHTYGDLSARYTKAMQHGKEIWQTEKNINSGEGSYEVDSTWNYVWPVANEINHALVNVDASVYIWWYAKRFYSFIGDGSYETQNNSVLPRGYVMSHYAKYAKDTIRVQTTDTLSKDVHVGASTDTGRVIGISAFIRKATPAEGGEEAKLQEKEDSLSLIIYDRRLEPKTESGIRINFPAGFTASTAFGILSDGTVYHQPIPVVLGPDGTYADVTLPSNAIISVKFVK